jgi:uncharacterized metal-binding protein YceD (DUF177 family)
MPRALPAPAPEFSRPVEIGEIGPEGVTREIAADAQEREALARRFGLVSLDLLEGRATVTPVSRKLFRLEATFRAELVQTCVVTLDPFPVRIEDSFAALFGEGGPGLAALLSAEEEDEPEPIEGGAIDIGETVAQHLALALDPYPRKPGATLPSEYAAEAASEAEPGRVKPFAGLDLLKPRRDG